jgi:hypothetical protein
MANIVYLFFLKNAVIFSNLLTNQEQQLNSMKKTLAFIITVLFFACQEQQPVEPTIYSIDKDLALYLKTFTDEAKTRGIEVKAENLIMKFGLSSGEACGECIIEKSNGQRTVIISNDVVCWEFAVRQNREALVFHELGHCLLGRSHRNDNLPNGAIASIMNKNYQINGPYDPCVYAIGGDNSCNKTSRRAYYIDELFNTKTSIPDWGK